MRFLFLALLLLGGTFTWAINDNDPKDASCASRLVPHINKRFQLASLDRLIPISDTKQMFDALANQQVRFGGGIFSRTIRVPTFLAQNFGNKYSRIAVSISIINWPGMPDAKKKNQNFLHRQVGASILIRLGNANVVQVESASGRELAKATGGLFAIKWFKAVEEREFSERFLKRQDLVSLLKEAKTLMGPKTKISANGVGSWSEEADIHISVDGFTHAEFDTVLNLLAKHLDTRAEK